jgi:signal peptidase II
VAPDTRAGAALIALAALAVDQLTKWLLRGADELPYDLVAGVRLTLVYNSGISFGRLRGLGDTLIAAVAVLVVAVAVALVLAPARYRPGIALILGGSASNLVDRLRFDGAVVDFIDTAWWPAFNLADAFIVAGVALVLLAALRASRA